MSNERGEYDYYEYEHGKVAEGFAAWVPSDERERNNYEQSKVVKEQGVDNSQAKNFHEKDEGGHLIANQLKGSGHKENLTAQNHDTNVQMKGIERHVADLAKEDAKNIEQSKDNSMDRNTTFYQVISYGASAEARPDNYMINITHVDKDGNVTHEHESIMNYSKEEQEEWEKAAEEAYKEDDPRPTSEYNPEEDEVVTTTKSEEDDSNSSTKTEGAETTDTHDEDIHEEDIQGEESHDEDAQIDEDIQIEEEIERDDDQGPATGSSEEEGAEEGVDEGVDLSV